MGVIITSIGIRAFHVAIRKREFLLYKMRLVLCFLCLYGGAIFILTKMRQPFLTVLFGSVLAGLCAYRIVQRPSDTRYIPKHVKRAVIERDLGDEEEYDSDLYHFDHIVPHSKGGDASVKNLRLISKRRNLRRGNRNPRLRDFYDVDE